MALHVPLPLGDEIGLYVHIPFCRHICPYCDFNTYSGQEDRIPGYVDALIAELALVDTDRRARTLFFGGGTPSLLTPAQIATVIVATRERFALAADAEVSLESNPESLTAEYLAGLREAGVNRLSIGIQSMQRAGLRVLGRGHTAATAGEALRLARDAGFDNVSLDFIFGWPGQGIEDWQRDLEWMLEAQPDHLSLYSLIVEPGTPMHAAVRRGILHPVPDDSVADMFEQASAALGDAGWVHYEVANFARTPAFRSQHNQLYWQAGEYFGFGAGAFGTIGSTRFSNVLLPDAYMQRVAAGQLPRAIVEELSPETSMGETMMLGLRLLLEGVSATDFAARHGVGLRERYAEQIDRFTSIGMLEWTADDRLRLAPAGVLLANDVCAAFLA